MVETIVFNVLFPKKMFPAKLSRIPIYIGHSAGFKLFLPYENLTSHWLCPEILDQNIVMTMFQACYVGNKYRPCMTRDIFLGHLVLSYSEPKDYRSLIGIQQSKDIVSLNLDIC